jgi:hypothetical protein
MRYQIETYGDDPISLADIKRYMKIDTDDDDTVISAIASSVFNYAEQITGRNVRANVWLAFPEEFSDGLILNRMNIETVEVSYVLDGANNILDPQTYWLKKGVLNSCLMLVDGYSWPSVDREDSIMIRFEVSTDYMLPQMIIAMLRHIALAYENRGDELSSTYYSVDIYRQFMLGKF